jgi:hypothetical protein
VSQVENAEVGSPDGDWDREQRPDWGGVCVELRGLRMSAQVVDAQTLADGQATQQSRGVTVDAGVHKSDRATVGPTNTERSDPSAGQRHRGFYDPVQRAVKVEIGTDLNDHLYQLFYLVASYPQFVSLITHLAH